jgi:hypothetical protein
LTNGCKLNFRISQLKERWSGFLDIDVDCLASMTILQMSLLTIMMIDDLDADDNREDVTTADDNLEDVTTADYDVTTAVVIDNEDDNSEL